MIVYTKMGTHKIFTGNSLTPVKEIKTSQETRIRNKVQYNLKHPTNTMQMTLPTHQKQQIR